MHPILPNNQQGYNTALYESVNTQLFLNIVRVRYGVGVYFLDVGGIQAQAETEASLAGSYNKAHALDNTYLLALQQPCRRLSVTQ